MKTIMVLARNIQSFQHFMHDRIAGQKKVPLDSIHREFVRTRIGVFFYLDPLDAAYRFAGLHDFTVVMLPGTELTEEQRLNICINRGNVMTEEDYINVVAKSE